uniref:Potassium channel domain-containing protein n=1 Tax=Panagrolaimus davidi TaxID=227884 RepID=A0A914PTH3_9BILA
MSLIPNIVKLFLGISYIVIGALIFQEIDPSLAKESFPDVLLFTFSSVTTIGWGSIVPSNKTGTIFSIFYICCGVPTVFLVLSNFSEMIAEFYWIIIATYKGERELATDHPHHLPVPIAMLLILSWSAFGCILFSWIMPDLDYVDTFYFSFISTTTIGLGDISPKTSSLSEAIIIIAYLSFGIIILSSLIASLTVIIRRIHYIGRSFEGAEYVEVYFGGSKFTIAELLEIVSEQFNVTPVQLREVIQELDELINIAVEEPQSENMHGVQGEDVILPPTRENQQSISISVSSKQTNYTSRFSDIEQIKLIQAVGTMCHLSQSGKKSFRSGAPSIIQHYSRTVSNPPIQPHSCIPNAFKKRSLSIENTKFNNQNSE